jgi:putative redox protein
MVKVSCSWKEKLVFEAQAGSHKVLMDAKSPVGGDSAATPKELALSAVCGCTAMDVMALMRKYKQTVKSFRIEAQTDTTTGHPAVFTEVHLKFIYEGEIEAAKAIEAVTLSQTKYCGVSAMMAKACPILYTIELNGQKIAEAKAAF